MDFPGHFSHVFQQLNHQRHQTQLCDCVVVVGSQTFQAHRSILAASSSHFRALLTSTDGNEVGGSGIHPCLGGSPSVMKLDPEVVTPDAFSTLLDMIYTSTLSLGASNVMDVLLAASHLHLNMVVKACKLLLSKCNFPTSPPDGWMSMHQQLSPSCHGSVQESSDGVPGVEHDAVTSAMGEGLVGGSGGLGVSQYEGDGGGRSGDHHTVPTAGHKRKLVLPDERLKRCCRHHGVSYSDPSHSVALSTSITEEGGEEELSSAERLNTAEEVEEKYEAPKAESEELQLPSQLDNCAGGVREDEEERCGGTVVKVKVGDEELEEEETVVEVKKENLSSPFADVDPVANNPPSPEKTEAAEEDCGDQQVEPSPDEETATASSADNTCTTSQPHSSTDNHMYSLADNGHVGEESMNGEGLDSFSELALSCFLTPSGESVMGALEMDDVLPNLTVTAVATAPADALATAGEASDTSSNPSSDCPASLVFPLNSVPFQPLLSTQGHGFSNTLILQHTQSCLGGFLRGIRPAPSLEVSVTSPPGTGQSKGGGSSGSSVFRRIAPKATPGSEGSADPDPSSSPSGSAGDAASRPPLTRASEDVMSKCKKAATQDHVLLVEGEKKYACSICCKTFMNLTDCKKHIRVHTGEKPYPCPTCGKRFSQSSHLYKHSKNTCLHWKAAPHAFSDTLL